MRKFGIYIAIAALIAIILFLGNRKGFGGQQYAQFIIDGIRGGTIYALVALGLVVIHNVTGIVVCHARGHDHGGYLWA